MVDSEMLSFGDVCIKSKPVAYTGRRPIVRLPGFYSTWRPLLLLLPNAAGLASELLPSFTMKESSVSSRLFHDVILCDDALRVQTAPSVISTIQ